MGRTSLLALCAMLAGCDVSLLPPAPRDASGIDGGAAAAHADLAAGPPRLQRRATADSDDGDPDRGDAWTARAALTAGRDGVRGDAWAARADLTAGRGDAWVAAARADLAAAARASGHHELDYDGDGDWEERSARIAPDAVAREHDLDGDGRADWRAVDRYAGGALVAGTVDADADGAVDELYRIELDARSRPERYVQDLDGDGRADRIEQFEYDALDRRSAVHLDADADGVVDDVRRFDPPCPPPYEGCTFVPAC